MKTKTRLGITLVAAILIVGGVVSYYHQKAIKQPELNPNPKHILTISGSIDPRLLLSFSAVYFTTNPSCEISGSWLEGAWTARGKTLNYPTIIKNKHYSIQVPLDGLNGGYCGWVLDGIDYTTKLIHTNKKAKGPFLYISKKPNTTMNISFICKKSNDPAFPLNCYTPNKQSYLSVKNVTQTINAIFKYQQEKT